MIRQGLLLILSVTLKLGLSCTCDHKNDTEAYCDKSDFDLPVVGIKIKKIMKRNEVELEKRCLPPRTSFPPWMDELKMEPTISPPSVPCGNWKPRRDKRVLAKVFKVIRQGTDVKVKKGRKIYIKTRISGSECGRDDDLQKGRRFIMKWPRDPQFRAKKPQTRISFCDFFPDWQKRSEMTCGPKNKNKKKRNKDPK